MILNKLTVLSQDNLLALGQIVSMLASCNDKFDFHMLSDTICKMDCNFVAYAFDGRIEVKEINEGYINGKTIIIVQY